MTVRGNLIQINPPWIERDWLAAAPERTSGAGSDSRTGIALYRRVLFSDKESKLAGPLIKRELEVSRSEMAVPRNEIVALRGFRTALDSELESSRSEVAVLRNEIVALRGSRTVLDNSRIEVNFLSNEVTTLRRLQSWRLTAPLRIVASGLKRVLKKVSIFAVGKMAWNMENGDDI